MSGRMTLAVLADDSGKLIGGDGGGGNDSGKLLALCCCVLLRCCVLWLLLTCFFRSAYIFWLCSLFIPITLERLGKLKRKAWKAEMSKQLGQNSVIFSLSASAPILSFSLLFVAMLELVVA